MTPRQLPRILLLVLVGLALGLFARWLFAADSQSEVESLDRVLSGGIVNSDSLPLKASEAIHRSDLGSDQLPAVSQEELDKELKNTYERIRDSHLKEAYRVDDERSNYMMSRGGTRDLTRSLGAYLMGEPYFPAPEESDFRGLGFAGEIQASNVIGWQADYLSRMTRGKVSPLKTELPEGAAIASWPLEAIVSRLTNSTSLEFSTHQRLNLAGIRDGFLTELTVHLQDQWFERSVINRAHQLVGLPIEDDVERLRALFPRYDAILREQDALSRLYLDTLRIELAASK